MSDPSSLNDVEAAATLAADNAGGQSASPAVAQSRAAIDAGNLLARAYAVCALTIGSSLAFFVSGVAPLPVLLYFPLSRRFGFQAGGELSMDYYGRSLLAILFGAAVSLVVYVLTSTAESVSVDRASGPPLTPDPQAGLALPPNYNSRPDRLALLAAYTLTAALLAAGLFAYQLAGRVPTPEPLPTAAHGPRN